MAQPPDSQKSLVLSYLQLRKAVGIIGVALPLVLALGNLALHGCGVQDSMSAYYYTGMRNVFVGSMWAIGVFMFSTKGYDRWDEVAGIFASIFAIGVSLFPTTPSGCTTCRQKSIGDVHLACAALLFLTLACMSIRLFTKTAPGGSPTPQKLWRNRIYRVCGCVIIACVALCAVVKLPHIRPVVEGFKPTFWLESLAVVAFGLSWLVKGETILKDQDLPAQS